MIIRLPVMRQITEFPARISLLYEITAMKTVFVCLYTIYNRVVLLLVLVFKSVFPSHKRELGYCHSASQWKGLTGKQTLIQ